MHSAAKQATKAEIARWRRFPDVGCVACYQLGHYRQPEVHHLNTGGKAGQKRRGHGFTIPLCNWHHRSVPLGYGGMKASELLMGPSLASSPRKFRARFGDDEKLLKLTNELIERIGDRANGR